MGESSEHSLEECIRAWRERGPYPSADAGEALADHHFSRGKFEAAAEAYATCAPDSERIRAKRGWCLAILDRCEEAANFLTPENCGSSSAELAVLAVTLAGGWNRHKLYGGSGVSAQEAQLRRAQVEKLVHRALNDEKRDPLAFYAYKDLVEWYEDYEAALAVAERAISLFRSPGMTEWHVRLLRILKRPNDAAFNTLLAQVPDQPWSTYVKEVFDSALALSRYDDACGALDLLEQQLRAAEDPLSGARLVLLRAYVDLRRALDADPGAAVRSLAAAATVQKDLIDGERTQDLRLFAAKLRLALAVVVSDAVIIREAAMAAIEAAWFADDAPDDSPGAETMWVDGVPYEADFGVGYQAPAVAGALPLQEQLKWKLLNALRLINDDEDPAADTRELMALHGVDFAPAWAARDVAVVLLSSQHLNARNAGRALARYCLHVERRDESYASAPNLEYDDLSLDQLGELVDGIVEEFRALAADAGESGQVLLVELGSVLTRRKAYLPLKVLSTLVVERAPSHADAVFYTALSHQEMNQLAVARTLYERLLTLDPEYRAAYWNVTLIHEAQGNADALEGLLPELEQRAGADVKNWAKTRDRARAALTRGRQQQATTDLRAFVSRELGKMPGLRSTRVRPTELSLLEAACLVALLRASELNHSTWTLAPFAENAHPFEPTHKFRSALLDLAMKGVIRIADSTPMDAFTASDGQLRFYLDRVVWSISPRTLALQSEIREMARHHWPEHWDAHAEMLSRDLATEECVAYIEYLSAQRTLDPPEQSEARAVFRELLEHCSVGKCWYYIYSGVQSANDYRTKYPVSRAQVTAMMLKRTRERGEIAIARGWDTSYSRIRALPRSHLSAALHDVLTGWGERAFEEPIRVLAQPNLNTATSGVQPATRRLDEVPNPDAGSDA